MSLQIIAEVAQGFEGKIDQSRLLIKAAAAAGADAVKFQLVFADELATPDYKYYDLFRSLEMSEDTWLGLSNYAKNLGIELFLDIFGERSLRLSEKMNVSTIKLHGTDVTNIGLLELVSKSMVPNILLGAGGAYLSEIRKALSMLSQKKVVVLLGYQGYPTPDNCNQIDRIRKLKDVFSLTNVSIGFADHADPASEQKNTIPAAALGAGAVVIEKHLTLGKSMKLEDHESALNPDEFFYFVKTIRACSEAMGKVLEVDDFGMGESEKEYRNMIRRHVVSKVDLKKDEKIDSGKLVLKRSAIENYIDNLEFVYEKIARRDIRANTPITKEDIV
ncbi:N-acetylneuraminate synthase family protein [Leptospira interrogans]|uniref:N-acetylneuraminate synthase family protein n=1 Tax=Leptospira interrogans TaxID=173 RepID=UPI0010C12513|nr:N-acetylneuraminate synthase family protein [Leptospira interrogans]KAA1266721.1 NeuB family protein [Leptospira interrogans serovar Weerasinghe]QCO37046.1 NeuB family protein [Leptospira interrogans]QCO41446.1 NeuB family protein [Leptospira interrogans]ULG80178.1 N-acetylneuraminate synthase family protein [Leptospira interrogans]ULG93772.1 N-acetylneuraminate synthase family protein [Leptospira interrogans]